VCEHRARDLRDFCDGERRRKRGVPAHAVAARKVQGDGAPRRGCDSEKADNLYLRAAANASLIVDERERFQEMRVVMENMCTGAVKRLAATGIRATLGVALVVLLEGTYGQQVPLSDRTAANPLSLTGKAQRARQAGREDACD